MYPLDMHAHTYDKATVARKLGVLTQILMFCPDAEQSQYLFGLKTSALMTSLPGSVYKCFPSFKSHSIAFPS